MTDKKTLHVRVWCQASYESEIQVPSDMTLDEAFAYAKDHIHEIPVTTLEYLPDSDELDDEDINNEIHTYFEE